MVANNALSVAQKAGAITMIWSASSLTQGSITEGVIPVSNVPSNIKGLLFLYKPYDFDGQDLSSYPMYGGLIFSAFYPVELPDCMNVATVKKTVALWGFNGQATFVDYSREVKIEYDGSTLTLTVDANCVSHRGIASSGPYSGIVAVYAIS